MAKKTIRGKFNPSVTAERNFMRALKKVARVSGHIVESHVEGVEIKNNDQLQKALKDYSKLIQPWATRQSAKLLEQVQKANKRTGALAATQSGERVRVGMDGIDALVHIDIEHTRKDGVFGINVGKSRGPGGHDIQDQHFDDLDFSQFAQLVFPDSSEEDWA